ncbi:BTAD domain-containing putative transcriptional regulator [soil metagenome]
MTISDPAQLGTLIRRFRLAGGLSQEQLAERSGLSARAVSDLERGQRAHTRPETLRMLAEGMALGNEDRQALLQAARPELRPSSDTAISVRSLARRLPIPPSALIGRHREVSDLVSRLAAGDGRLITLTGPGGVGKTRLALEAAHLVASSYPEGVEFVDLAPVTDTGQVASAIAGALSIRESGNRSNHETLRTALGNRRLLLLLDNFEQVIEAAPLVGELLAGASELRVLATSRESLRIRGEEEVVIDPLDLPTEGELADLDRLAKSASVELFVAAAMSVKPEFELTADNAGQVAGICRRLDGLPLAIELAASRVKHFPPGVLLERLERRLPVLTGGSRDLPARQQTLWDTIAWSYDLLSPDEQTLFRRVGAFPGGASLEALDSFSTVADALELDLLSGLASLVDKSLVLERMGAGEAPRFSMLETVREFAGEMVVRAGELEISRSAVVAWALEFASSGKGGMFVWMLGLANLQQVDEEIDNVRRGFDIAADRRDAESCALFFDGIYGFLYVRGLFGEAVAMGQKVLELAESSPIPDDLRGRTLTQLSFEWSMLFAATDAEQLAREGLALTQIASSNALHAISALHALVMAVRNQGRYAEALDYAEQADALASTPAGEPYRALTKYSIGRLSYLLDDQDRAVEYLSESMDRSLQFGANEEAVYAGSCLVAALVRRGELLKAASTLRGVVRLWQEAGSVAAGLFLEDAAVLAAASGRLEVAAALFAADSAQNALFGMRDDSDLWTIEAIEAVHTQLGDEAFESASLEGRTLSLEAAIVVVTDLLEQIEQGGAVGGHVS